MRFCTYLTIYYGNKLPMFYIGHSTIEKINDGYHGSVQSKRYKTTWESELKDHPELFKTLVLTTHSKRKEASDRESRFQRALSVIKNPLYVNMSYWPYFDKFIPRTDEWKQKISQSLKKSTKNKGRIPWNKGKRGCQVAWNKGKPGTRLGVVLSSETRERMKMAAQKRVKEHGPPINGFKKGNQHWKTRELNRKGEVAC